MRAEAKDGFVSFDKLPSNTYAVVKNAPSADAPQFAAAFPKREPPGLSPLAVSSGGMVVPLSLTPGGTVVAEGVVTNPYTQEETDVHWALTVDNFGEHTLTFSGSGEIPNFSSGNNPPWYAYKDTQMTVVFEDGVTKIGNYSMSGMKGLTDMQIGTGVTAIGNNAFQNTKLTSISIPGNVETIGDNAFYNVSTIKSITLGEGVKTIGSGAFATSSTSSKVSLSGPLNLPASLESFGGAKGQTGLSTTAYIVPDNSEHFKTDDGVLYNKDMTELVAYPRAKVKDEYQIPNTVTKIRSDVFEGVKETRKIVIPGSVQEIPDGILGFSEVQELVVLDGANIVTTMNWFNSNKKIEKVTFPEDDEFIMAEMFSVDAPIESLRIPKLVTQIRNQFSENNEISSLMKLEYNAQNAEIRNKSGSGAPTFPIFSDASYVLEIGKDVDRLQPDFKWISCDAESLVFEGANFFTAEEGAFETAPEPFTGLSGDFYVDGDGALYKLDTTDNTNTARLIFVPGNVENLTVPAQITNAENTSNITYNVTGVASNALKQASALTSISFDAPGSVVLEPYALANCPTLGSVNSADTSATTVEAATALFGSDNVGSKAFYNTGLTDAGSPSAFERDMDGSKGLTVTHVSAPEMGLEVSSSGETREWTPKADDDIGGYRLLTGDSMTINVSVGNTGGAQGADYVYRVYVQRTDEGCSLNFEPGQTYTYESQTVICYATSDADTLCLEFVPGAGVTVSFPIIIHYPSPTSPGGGVTVWGEIKPKQGNEGGQNLNTTPPTNANKIQASWQTNPDPFVLTKNATRIPSAGNLVKASKEGNECVIRPGSDIVWEINFKRSDQSDLFGKNYATRVEFEDYMKLPDQFEWDPRIKQGIIDGNINYRKGYRDREIEVNGKHVFTFETSARRDVRLLKIEWDDEKGPVFHWMLRNLNKTSEIKSFSLTLSFLPGAIRLKEDVTNFGEGVTATMENTVKTKIHYTYGEGREPIEDSAESIVKGKNGNISIEKSNTDPKHKTFGVNFGEETFYDIKVHNDGAMTWPGTADTYVVRDELNQGLRISPENMEKMFKEADEAGTPLTVTVENAVLAEYQEVTGADGTPSYRHGGNSNLGDKHTLTITAEKGSGDDYSYAVAVEGVDSPYIGSSLEAALRAAGFADTPSSTYTCVWQLFSPPERTGLLAGEEKTFQLRSTVKDTFGFLGSDWPVRHKRESERLYNTAKILKNNDFLKSARADYVDARREAAVNKSVYRNGVDISAEPEVEEGDVLDYRLEFEHKGKGKYKHLPMVDEIIGSQYLLVPKEENTALANRELAEYTDTTDNNKVYYKLKEGTYENVKVGVDESGVTLNAATVVVEETAPSDEAPHPGLKTTIKWYFPELLPRDGSKPYLKTVDYKVLIDTELTGKSFWSLGNIVYMNDKPDDRIKKEIGKDGTLLDFDKKIVREKGNTPAGDLLYEDDYSAVGRGESVTYRLWLHNTADFPLTLTGKDIVDCLPDTYRTFNWSTDNIVLSDVVKDDGVEVTNIDGWSVNTMPDDLRAKYGEIGDRQYIVWQDDTTSIYFPVKRSVYLYFTLTFPKNEPENPIWSNYVQAVNGGLLDNTFYVYRFRNPVTHELREPGKAAIQKGVLSLSWDYQYDCTITPGSSRRFYNNLDSTRRFVSYYVTVYNGGHSRLYLDDIYDILPEGFSYRTLDNRLDSPGLVDLGSSYNLSNTCVYTGDERLVSLPEGTTIMSAKITAHSDDDNATPLRFSIGAGQGSKAIKYEELRESYYLEKDQALVFAYQCKIDKATDNTEDIAVNTVGMRYIDRFNAGVEDDADFRALAENPKQHCSDSNDGNHSVQMSGQLQGSGLPAAAGEEWLVSEVMLQRGEIVPGVTKSTVSYEQGGTPLQYTTHVPADNKVQVNWKLRFSNSGTRAIQDFTVEDILPAPFVFCGKVSAELRSADEKKLKKEDFFEILSITESDGGKVVKVKVLYDKTQEKNQELDIVVNGDPLQIHYESNGNPVVAEVAFKQDEHENMKLILHADTDSINCFNEYGEGFAIPECGGYMDLSVSGKNPTYEHENKVYINKACFKPEQHFTSVCAGSGVIDGGTLKSVKNSAPFTVAFGYATSSSKSVTETIVPENTADSTDSAGNCIVLATPNSSFTYTLTVNNTTEKAMTKLVLIDNLPDIGDHGPFDTDDPRGSAFKVNFASEPNVTVKVEKKNEDPVTLTSEQYTVQYSATTDFGGTQSNDWKGEASGTTATWGNFTTDARSIRVIIKDDAGTLIPANSKIELSFDAVAEGTQTPGAIAWNSFGYHYALKDISQNGENELEAMPLPVGVKTPSVPKLKKSLTDLDGLPYTTNAALSFTFTISDNATTPNTKDVTLTVPANASSAEVLLDSTVMGNWTWDKDKTYTIQETENAENFELGSWTNVTSVIGDVASFRYEPGKNLTLECTNIRNLWSLTLNKVSAIDNAPLPGAVFALYSPNEEDKMDDAAYDALTCNPKPEKTRTVEDETWYLQGIETTAADGTIKWENLTREKYCLFEVTPPPGYYASAEPIIVARSGASTVVTAVNETGFVLPDTGGRGTFSYALAGIVLMVLALGLQFRSMLRDRRA